MHFKSPESGGAVRSYLLAKGLTMRGFDIEVIAAHNNPSKTIHIDGFTVHFLRIVYANHFGFIKRVYAFLKFHLKSLKKFGSLQKPDLVYAITTPLSTGLTAKNIKKKYGINYVFEVGDLWPEAPVQMGVISSNFLKKKLFELETEFYRNASLIVSLSPAITDYIKEKSDTSIITAPNFSDMEYFEPVRPASPSPFIISYTGAIGKANHIDYIIDAAKELQDAPIIFKIMGEGSELNRLKTLAKGLGNVEFYPFGNRKKVKELLNSSHAIYISYYTIPVLETGSPNKLFDGLAAGKLIITNFGGWIEKLITENYCGFKTNPRNPKSLLEQLEPYFNNSVLDEVSENSRELSKRFDKNLLIAEIESALHHTSKMT